MKRREFIEANDAEDSVAGIPLLSSAVVLAQAVTIAKKIRVDPQGITVLLGYEAELSGNLCQFPGFPKAGDEPEKDRRKWKKYSPSAEEGGCWIEVWESTEDSFVWQVEVPEAGYYRVYMRGTGAESEVEIATDDSKIAAWLNNGKDAMWDAFHYPPVTGKWRADFTPPSDYLRLIWNGWDRMPMGTLYLAAGEGKITVRAKKVGEDMGLHSVELVRPEIERALTEKAEKLRSSTKWLADGKYGLFFHWTSGTKTDDSWKAVWPQAGERKVFPKNVEDFNVGAFVEMVRETGAGHIVFSATWATHCFPAPIKAIDKILPGRTSQRDLIRELADGLAKYGIKLMLYYHLGHGADTEWWEKTKANFVDNWCAITSEAGRRYGTKLAGWWFVPTL